MKRFKSGAIRSEEVPRYDLIPMEGLRRLAVRYTAGAAKYGEVNWQKGLRDPEFLKQAKAHIMEHLLLYFEQGCALDDNLAAIAWGCMTLMESEKTDGKKHNVRYNQRGRKSTKRARGEVPTGS